MIGGGASGGTADREVPIAASSSLIVRWKKAGAILLTFLYLAAALIVIEQFRLGEQATQEGIAGIGECEKRRIENAAQERKEILLRDVNEAVVACKQRKERKGRNDDRQKPSAEPQKEGANAGAA